MFDLYDAFKTVKNKEEFENLFRDLFTPTEIKDLNDRFMVAQLLDEGKLSQRDIAAKVKCSITTVTRVSRFLKQEPYGGYRTVLNNLKKPKNHNNHR